MKKSTLLIALTLASTNAMALPPKMDVEKIMQENSIVIKGFKKVGIDIMDMSKEMNKSLNEKPKPETLTKKRELKNCMGKDQVISNETINCYYGTE